MPPDRRTMSSIPVVYLARAHRAPLSAGFFSGVSGHQERRGSNGKDDRRNRYRACVECNRPPDIKDLTEVAGADADPRQYVINKNLLRRHLTISQRSMYMGQYATYQRGDSESQRIEKAAKNHDPNRNGSLDLTSAEAAAMAQVSERSLQHAKVVLTEGTEEEKKAVTDGSLKPPRHRPLDLVLCLFLAGA
jgi:hypothetical protein